MNKLSKIEIDQDGGVSFFFDNSDEPFVPEEFGLDSQTRKYLFEIQHAIQAELSPEQESIFSFREHPLGV